MHAFLDPTLPQSSSLWQGSQKFPVPLQAPKRGMHEPSVHW